MFYNEKCIQLINFVSSIFLCIQRVNIDICLQLWVHKIVELHLFTFLMFFLQDGGENGLSKLFRTQTSIIIREGSLYDFSDCVAKFNWFLIKMNR